MLKYKAEVTLSDNSKHQFDVAANSEKDALNYANHTIDEILEQHKDTRIPINVKVEEEYIDEF